MPLTRPTYAVDNVSSLSTTPNATEGLTGEQLQAKIDKTGADNKTYLTDILLPEIDEEIANLDTDITNINAGWINVNTTLTYSSWDSEVSTAVLNTNIDLTNTVELGDRLKFTQDGAIKFGIVTAKTSTTLTLYLGTDYTLTNTSITDVYFSHMKTPLGFNVNKDKWTITVKNTSNTAQAKPNGTLWYNVGSIKISIGVGEWKLSYMLILGGWKGATTIFSAKSTLATQNNAETDKDFTCVTYFEGATATITLFANAYREKNISVPAKTNFFLNVNSDADSVNIYGNLGTTVIKAECAYV